FRTARRSDKRDMVVSPEQADVHRDLSSLAVKSAVVRSDAAHLRSEAAFLRRTTRVIVRESRERRHTCLLNYPRACPPRAEPVASPWSTLLWRRPDAELDRVLLAISGRPSRGR